MTSVLYRPTVCAHCVAKTDSMDKLLRDADENETNQKHVIMNKLLVAITNPLNLNVSLLCFRFANTNWKHYLALKTEYTNSKGKL